MALDASFLLVICDKPCVRPHLPHAEAEREEPRPPVLTRLSAAVQPGAREWGGQGAVPRHLWLRCGPFKRTSPAPAVSSKLCVHALEGHTTPSARYAVGSRGCRSLALSLPTGLAGAYAGSQEVTHFGYGT